MVEVVEQTHQQLKPGTGRPTKLTTQDQVLMTLEYLREYRTYFHIAQSWGVKESTAYRIIRKKVEDYLISSGVFSLPGKKKLLEHEHQIQVVVVDVTESQIERPQKNRTDSIAAKRKDILRRRSVSGSAQVPNPSRPSK